MITLAEQQVEDRVEVDDHAASICWVVIMTK